MSDKSDEELVGDVDFDFDDFDSQVTECKTTVTKVKSVKEKPTASVKQPVKKKKNVKEPISLIQDDMLQAFAIGAISVQKESGFKKKAVVKIRKISDKSVESWKDVERKKQDNQEGIKKNNQNEINKDNQCEIKKKRNCEIQKEKQDKIKEGHHQLEVKTEILDQNKTEFQEIKKKIQDDIKTELKTEIQDIKKELDEEIKKKENKGEKEIPIQDDIKAELKTEIQDIKKELDEEKKKKENKGDKEIPENQDKVMKSQAKDKVANPQKVRENETTKHKIEESHKTNPPSKIENIPANTKSEDSKSRTQTLKRKAVDTNDTQCSPKSPKTTSSSEALHKGSPSVKKDTETGIKFTEDDYKSMDNHLADQMMKKSLEKTTSRNDIKYTVQVSPLEIADLAHPSLQMLIQLHPTLSLMFKHQTVKFKKKKGFAEAAFSTMTELKEFVYQLTQIKVIEKRIDVTIKALGQSNILSFVIHLNRNGKLLSLLDTGEDPMINKPIPIGQNPHKIQFEKVPSTISGAFLHSMFPFTNNVLVTRSQVGKGKDSKINYHGPLSVYYINFEWLEAVMDCCSDFTVDGFPLTVIGDFKSGERYEKTNYDEKRGSCGESDQRIESSMEIEEDVDDDDDDDDDPVSNMTRDVCADVLESIQKLRDLDSNNPNMKKIIEMQNQLNALQNSLCKSRTSKLSESGQEKEQLKKTKLTPAEKRQREMKELEDLFEEADKAERQKEEEIKQKRERDLQKKKELDQKKKTQWAKTLLSDFKKKEGVGDKLSAEAEKILRLREERKKEREEEEERKKEEDLKKQEEEEKLKLKREQEEKFREAERRRLIEKIEETRLRDSQKFSSSQLMWNPASGKSGGDETHSPGKNRSSVESSTGRKGSRDSSDRKKSANDKKSSASDVRDDGLDDRLADFARELVELGRIDKEALPSRTSNKPADRRQPSKKDDVGDELILSEDEYQDLVATDQLHTVSGRNYQVRVAGISNRLCPVQSCPSRTHFRDIKSFMDHWVIFHQARTSMRFCPNCSAYFMNPNELENHIMKHHRYSSKEAIELVRNARVKVIANPSYRDPYPFIPPISSP